MNRSTQLLDAEQINAKLQRLAWELYDRHSRTKQLHVVGIKDNGYWLAQQLTARLSEISDIEITLHSMSFDKDKPVPNSVALQIPEGSEIALIDDVLNSGRTLLNAVIKLMSYKPKSLSTTVLVDRSHKRYPVKADIKGVSLSTTLQETVHLTVEDGKALRVSLH